MSINRKFYCLHLKHEYRGVAQLVERVVWDHQAAGSSPVTPTRQGLEPIRAPGSFLYRGRDARALIGIFCIPGRHVETSYARSDFLFHKKSSTCSTVPPFCKKSRSAHLFGCKRLHDGSLSLPTFCGLVLRSLAGIFLSTLPSSSIHMETRIFISQVSL